MFVEEDDDIEIDKILDEEEHQQSRYVGPIVTSQLAMQRLREQNLEMDQANFYEDHDPIEGGDRIQVKVSAPPSQQELITEPFATHPERVTRLKNRLELRREYESDPTAYMRKRQELRDLIQAKAPR